MAEVTRVDSDLVRLARLGHAARGAVPPDEAAASDREAVASSIADYIETHPSYGSLTKRQVAEEVVLVVTGDEGAFRAVAAAALAAAPPSLALSADDMTRAAVALSLVGSERRQNMDDEEAAKDIALAGRFRAAAEGVPSEGAPQ